MIGFIVQARLGSTRMPGKILKPFDGGRCILELMLEKLRGQAGAITVVATSTSPTDDAIAELCGDLGVACYRGPEDDVLARYIEAAEAHGIDRIVRVCSDNPFLDKDALKEIIEAAKNTDCDYVSFDVGGRPSIKTHFGFWTEYVSLEVLRKVAVSTGDRLYHEHVTNYIYSHPERFKIGWLPVDKRIAQREDIRLTIDTPEDFRRAQAVCRGLSDENPGIDGIIDFLDRHPDLMAEMREAIVKNSK